MNFSTYEFIFLFLPIVLILYYAVSNNTNGSVLQKIILIASSFVFFAFGGLSSLVLFGVSIIVNYVFTGLLSKRHSKILLAIIIIFNVFLLATYKYADFLIGNVNALIGTDFKELNLFYALGISFYTFQQMLFMVNVYRNGKTINNFGDYVLFVAFFPKIVSGPIMTYEAAIKAFDNRKCQKIDYQNLSAGLYIFCIGLFKKLVISDTVALFANTGYGMVEELNFLQAWVTALSYTFQIYFDFSGYSDMAIGVARMFNIELPINFNSPYKAEGITDFWRKWHITMGKTLTNIIYIPLGGNRKGIARTCINVVIVFLVSGIWHGAGWTFVIWGIVHGLLEVVEKSGEKYWTKISSGVKKVYTFLMVNFLWVVFRAQDLKQAVTLYGKMFSISTVSWGSIGVLANDGIIPFPSEVWALYLLLMFALIIVILCSKKNSGQLYQEFKPTTKNIFFIIVLFVISVVHLSRLSVFVYSNF